MLVGLTVGLEVVAAHGRIGIEMEDSDLSVDKRAPGSSHHVRICVIGELNEHTCWE